MPATALDLAYNTDCEFSADFDDARVKAEYERGYKIVLGFFNKHT